MAPQLDGLAIELDVDGLPRLDSLFPSSPGSSSGSPSFLCSARHSLFKRGEEAFVSSPQRRRSRALQVDETRNRPVRGSKAAARGVSVPVQTSAVRFADDEAALWPSRLPDKSAVGRAKGGKSVQPLHQSRRLTVHHPRARSADHLRAGPLPPAMPATKHTVAPSSRRSKVDSPRRSPSVVPQVPDVRCGNGHRETAAPPRIEAPQCDNRCAGEESAATCSAMEGAIAACHAQVDEARRLVDNVDRRSLQEGIGMIGTADDLLAQAARTLDGLGLVGAQREWRRALLQHIEHLGKEVVAKSATIASALADLKPVANGEELLGTLVCKCSSERSWIYGCVVESFGQVGDGEALYGVAYEDGEEDALPETEVLLWAAALMLPKLRVAAPSPSSPAQRIPTQPASSVATEKPQTEASLEHQPPRCQPGIGDCVVERQAAGNRGRPRAAAVHGKNGEDFDGAACLVSLFLCGSVATVFSAASSAASSSPTITGNSSLVLSPQLGADNNTIKSDAASAGRPGANHSGADALDVPHVHEKVEVNQEQEEEISVWSHILKTHIRGYDWQRTVEPPADRVDWTLAPSPWDVDAASSDSAALTESVSAFGRARGEHDREAPLLALGSFRGQYDDQASFLIVGGSHGRSDDEPSLSALGGSPTWHYLETAHSTLDMSAALESVAEVALFIAGAFMVVCLVRLLLRCSRFVISKRPSVLLFPASRSCTNPGSMGLSAATPGSADPYGLYTAAAGPPNMHQDGAGSTATPASGLQAPFEDTAASSTPASGAGVTGLSAPATPFSVLAPSTPRLGAPCTPQNSMAPGTPYSLSPGTPHRQALSDVGLAAPATPICVAESLPGTPRSVTAGAAPEQQILAPTTPSEVVAQRQWEPAGGHFPVSFGSYYTAVKDGRMRVVRVMEPGTSEGMVTAVPCTRTRLRTFRMNRPETCQLPISELTMGPFGCAAGRPPKYVWTYLREALSSLVRVPEEPSHQADAPGDGAPASAGAPEASVAVAEAVASAPPKQGDCVKGPPAAVRRRRVSAGGGA